MVKKIEKVVRIIMTIYVLILVYLALFNSSVTLNEFSDSIGLVTKYKVKVLTELDYKKFDKMIYNKMTNNATDKELQDIPNKIYREARNFRYGYRRNWIIILVYLIVGLILLNRIEYIICIEYNKKLLKKGIKI
jgi:hypothetical protein